MSQIRKSPINIKTQEISPGNGLEEMDLSVNDASIDLISRNNSIAWYGNIFDGSFSVSVFQCDYQKFKPRDHSFDEFIMILEGTLTLTEDTGEIHEFKKGDTLVFPKEFKGTWENSDNYKELIIIESGAMNDIPSMQDHHE
jgi:uncharacterized cupin superfamily protein|tara:strand:- start:853 stop:1275 length:423 start_codon:yes stop_codon:yes gene_type:complete